jgi:hypothetical protein
MPPAPIAPASLPLLLLGWTVHHHLLLLLLLRGVGMVLLGVGIVRRPHYQLTPSAAAAAGLTLPWHPAESSLG